MKRLFLILFPALFIACVPQKEFDKLQAQYDSCMTTNESMHNELNTLQTNFTEVTAEKERLDASVAQLTKDTTEMGRDLRNMKKSYEELKESYDLLVENNNSMIAKNARENRKLLAEMETLEASLRAKEDSLRIQEEKLEATRAELEKREQRVRELESRIAEKDSILGSLTASVKEALLGYEGKGLSIEERNGKLYVTLENSLLFASGKWEVNENGKKAIQQLAAVLSENPDISILIEGHTDSDKFYGGQVIRDNWDLSVMRATAVVKILEDAGVNPTQMTAAGRSEYLPVATNESAEGKAQNRRIEIIIEPDISKLMELINE